MSKRFPHPKIVIQIMILQEGDTMTKISNLTILKNMPEEKREFSNILFQGKLLGSFVTAEFTDCTFQDCEIKGCFFTKYAILPILKFQTIEFIRYFPLKKSLSLKRKTPKRFIFLFFSL